MDVFFSYGSEDRERVRLAHDLLEKQGFDVFWDQSVPVGKNWSDWIMETLGRSRCVVVFWSRSSTRSQNVQHEATIARDQDKIIPLLLEELDASDFPMGHYSVQALKFHDWSGEEESSEWRQLIDEVEKRCTPAWLERRLTQKEAEFKIELKRKDKKIISIEETARALEIKLESESRSNEILRLDISSNREARKTASLPITLALFGFVGLSAVAGLGAYSHISNLIDQIKEKEAANKILQDRGAALVVDLEKAAARKIEADKSLSELFASLDETIKKSHVGKLEGELAVNLLRTLAEKGQHSAAESIFNTYMQGYGACVEPDPGTCPTSDRQVISTEEAARWYLSLVQAGRLPPPKNSIQADRLPLELRIAILKSLPGYSSRQRGTFLPPNFKALIEMYEHGRQKK